MATKTSKSLSAAGAALLACAALSPAAFAADNPFQMTELPAGYQLADAHGGKDGESKCGEGKCGEGKCGEGKPAEGKCGEGKCGEGKCGEEGDPGAKADSEGKCGEGKCGAMDDAE
ncbi:MAG: hypothetical protein WDA10_08450 [Porticoccaceae bacterium]